jgi:iron(III) transport system ATP-binding protein
VGAQVTLCIRPEFLLLAHGAPAPVQATGGAPAGAGTPADNVIEGRLESLDFVGEVYEAEVRVGDRLLLARVDPAVRAAPGDIVRFTLAPEHGLLVTE